MHVQGEKHYSPLRGANWEGNSSGTSDPEPRLQRVPQDAQ